MGISPYMAIQLSFKLYISLVILPQNYDFFSNCIVSDNFCVV